MGIGVPGGEADIVLPACFVSGFLLRSLEAEVATTDESSQFGQQDSRERVRAAGVDVGPKTPDDDVEHRATARVVDVEIEFYKPRLHAILPFLAPLSTTKRGRWQPRDFTRVR